MSLVGDASLPPTLEQTTKTHPRRLTPLLPMRCDARQILALVSQIKIDLGGFFTLPQPRAHLMLLLTVHCSHAPRALHASKERVGSEPKRILSAVRRGCLLELSIYLSGVFIRRCVWVSLDRGGVDLYHHALPASASSSGMPSISLRLTMAMHTKTAKSVLSASFGQRRGSRSTD